MKTPGGLTFLAASLCVAACGSGATSGAGTDAATHSGASGGTSGGTHSGTSGVTSGDGGGVVASEASAPESGVVPSRDGGVEASRALPGDAGSGDSGAGVGTFEQVSSFGSNPGHLSMYRYVPAGVPAHAPLVLALHGCEEVATDYATGTGWNTFADQGKFYVAYPQQPASNNAEACFTWWGSGASGIGRSAPEEVSMTEMVAKMEADFSIDASRVFVTGLSAGGAAALMLLADFPDVFAAGGVFAGVPYGCASDVLEATSCMSPGVSRSASAWGALALGADPSFKGAYPRVSLWAGSSDTVVAPLNLGQEVLQWTDVLGAPDAGVVDQVNGFPHTVYGHRDGGALVESYSITGMGHGAPVDPSAGCGAASEFFPD